ncbi:E3 ubiquitin-protein ligase huwe1 [Dirofilaria immitis]|nr:E3 ubiquitin-protein ligase huwe1 [Dirofilaria immitis]
MSSTESRKASRTRSEKAFIRPIYSRIDTATYREGGLRVHRCDVCYCVDLRWIHSVSLAVKCSGESAFLVDMKIDSKTLRPCNAEIFPRCMQLIEHIKSAPDRRTFLERLTEVHEWQPQFGKSEMARWSDVLNMCDDVLKDAVTCSSSPGAPMAIDEDHTLLADVTSVLSFTAMLFENTFTRSVYSSTDRLLNLLDSGNVEVVVETLRLLLVISKRSRFLSQHLSDVQQKNSLFDFPLLLSGFNLSYKNNFQCWNGKLRNMKMDECCTTNVRPSALLPIGFQTDTNNLVRSLHSSRKIYISVITNEETALKVGIPPLRTLAIWQKLEEDEHASFIARLRLVRSFNTSRGRRLSIIARLLSLSILVYTRSLIEEWAMTTMLYDGLIEEITRLLLINNTSESIIDAIKTEALRTLTSIVSLGRPAKLNVVVESLGVNSYHGFLARMTRQCVDDLRCGRIGNGYTTVPFCTALFSLLYHLAGFENGGEALVSCALTETLLGVVSCETLPLELITFVTRAVRVIDIMTSLDANGFTSCGGMSIIVHRLIFDVNICMKHLAELSVTGPTTEQCHQQRAALIKSLLNFIKRAVQDTQFADSTRHIMDGALPAALVNILTNCGFFGASLFHNAICLITNFIYQEPSLLTSLQEKGVTTAILRSIFHQELPTSRDVIAALPNTFTALCLNDRGLKAFMDENPFDHFCDIFVSTKYIYAMKCRRNEMNEVALNLGTSFDAFYAIIQPCEKISSMLNKLLDVASMDSPRCVMSLASCRSAQAATASSSNLIVTSASPIREDETIMGGNVSSDDDDDDPTSAEEMHTSENESPQLDLGLSLSIVCDGNPLVPLGEYLLNIGKFLETLLTHNASPEQADIFIQSGAADKLLSLLFVRQIPLELSQSLFPQLVTNIMRFLFQHTRSSDVMDMVANRLNKFCLDMLSSCGTNEDSSKPSLLAMSSSDTSLANISAISVFCSILGSLSKTALGSNTSTKTAILRFWTNEGCRLLSSCNHAQRVVVWECAVLQVFNATNKCTASTQTDDVQADEQIEEINITLKQGSVGADSVPQRIGRPKYLLDDYWLRSKSGTNALNRCNRQCTELMTMLVKISIGGMTKTRRIQENEGGTPCENAVQLALQIMKGFHQALEWKPYDKIDPAIMLPYLAVWINNLSNILFDERKSPYHLMLSAFIVLDFFFTGNESGDTKSSVVEMGQLLQAWLSLTERLVNAHAFRHSRYKMSERFAEAKRFPTEKYLTKCQQDAFRQASVIFSMLSSLPLSEAVNFNICDMIVSIYREIVKGIVPLTEKQKQAVVTTSEDRKKMEAELDGASIGLLVDMGFDRDAAVDALLEYSTVPEAAEYLIATDGLGRLRQSSTDERIDADEIDAEEGSGGQNGDLNVEFEDVLLKEPISLNEVPPLDTRLVLSSLCKDKCIEKVMVLQKNMLIGEYLVQDILLMVDELRCDETDEKTVISLATRLHFVCLLWPGIATTYMDVFTEYRLHSVLISVLDMVIIHCVRRPSFIKLIAPICLWLDLYDKMLRLLDSKDKVEKAIESYAWKYWDTDERGGVFTWINYPPAASHTLTNAFLAGRRNCSVSVGGRQYTVDFPSMSHRNVESHIERPITIAGRLKDGIILSEILSEIEWLDGSGLLQEIECLIVSAITASSSMMSVFASDHKEWNEIVRDRLVSAVIGLLGLSNIDTNSIHAVFILAARITRDFKIAREFLQQGGVQTVINVSGSAVPSSSLLAALIIRHCLDDEIAVRQIFEKRTPRTTRDWLHAIRALSPLCARHPQIFAATMERVTRKQKDQITVLPMTPVDPSCKQWAACSPIKQVLTHLLNHTLDFSWEDSNRVINRASLVRLIAELAKSYSIVATLVAESHDPNGQPFMVSLLSKCIVPSGNSVADGNLSMAVKTFVAAVASCSHSPKAQEALISSIISCLHIVFSEVDSKTACTKLRALSDLFLLARDACPTGPQDMRNNTNSNAILRLIVKKRVCIELSRVPWYLNLSTKEGIETLNYILRVLEELTRAINNNHHAAQNSVAENTSETRPMTQNASASVTLVATAENDASATVTAREGEHSQEDQHIEDGSSTADEHRFETHEVTVERNRPDDDDYCADDDEDRGRTRHADAVEDSSESEEDEDDADDDDDDEGAGLNEMDVDDESDDEHDDVMEEEGRVSVEEEDDFGMVELEPGALSRFALVDSVDDSVPADRFEDGDSEENFVNANIFVENLDDIDALTNGAFTGMESAHVDRSSVAITSVHPLLQRSSQASGSDSVVGQRPTSYRLLVGQRRGAGNVNPTGLHRQNAVRRWTTFGTQSEFIERLFDGSTANGTHLFDIAPSRQRFLNVVMQDHGLDSTTTAASEERRQTSVPLPLERFSDAARMIDGHAHLYLWVIVASHITGVMDAIEKDENEKKAEEEMKFKTEKDITEGTSKRNLGDTASNESTSTTRLFIDEEEHEDTGNADAIANTQPEQSSESVDIIIQTNSVPEPMDQSGTLYYDASENFEDHIHRTAELDGRQENVVSNENSNISTDASMHATPITTYDTEGQGNVEQLNTPESAPETSNSNRDDFREILGDIEIPEGVDPAFLAALPEDIRTEVIRDHMRQQRSQRLIQTSANLEAAGQANGEGGVPVVEPLDQEFLNALPPDLQEEILAQHERTVRLAQERVESNNAPPADSPVGADDAAALIESLPPTLRAQVLADADDTVLQVLPQNVAAEARRLRASYEAQQVMRFARMLAPTQRFRPANGRSVPGTSGNNTPVGAHAGVTTLASKNAAQLLDRDAIVTLLLLFFIDPVRLNTQRLQKLIKSLCAQNVTCDFIIWCLIALLDKVDEDAVQYEDFAGTVSGWLDQICVHSGIGQHEQAVKFFKSTHIVALHPAILATVCRLVLDTLINLAKTYPGHFLPAKLRTSGSLSSATLHTPPFSQFWAIVHGLSKADMSSRCAHRHGSSLETALGPGGVNASMAALSLEDSAVGVLMEHIRRPIVQTLPDETVTKMSIDSSAERPPLTQQLEHIVLALTEGECSEEGLTDGRTLLLELIRALTPSTKSFIMSLLINAAERLGARLLPHIERLEEELKELPSEGSPSSSFEQQPSGSKVALNRYDESVIVISGILNSRAVMNASGCYELQLPAMRALTDKNGVQNVFLRTLQTIMKIREVLQAHARCVEIDVSVDTTGEQDDEHVAEEDNENAGDERGRKKSSR